MWYQMSCGETVSSQFEIPYGRYIRTSPTDTNRQPELCALMVKVLRYHHVVKSPGGRGGYRLAHGIKGLEKEEEEKVRTPTLRKKEAMKSTEGKQHEGADQTHISASGHVMCLMIMQSKQR